VSEWVGSDTGVVDVVGPIETLLWLAVLVDDGPLHRCIVCSRMTVWRHPERGGVHPRCIPAAMAALDDGGGEPVAVNPSPTRSRGAYSRRGKV
jgi:hypothetical protein